MIDESKLSPEGRASLAKSRELNRKQNENANRRPPLTPQEARTQLESSRRFLGEPPLKESDWAGHDSTKS